MKRRVWMAAGADRGSRLFDTLRRMLGVVLVLGIVAASGLAQGQPAHGRDRIDTIARAELPPEARATLDLIRQGGPFPYRKDGTVFGNFERLLPLRERGYYREYTVRTPGARDRGARRIVAGRRGEHYYTEDHYESFKRIRD